MHYVLDADNGSVLGDHGRPGAPLLHVICYASVQWSLFSVKGNYPIKRSPARQGSPEKSTELQQRGFRLSSGHGRTFHVEKSSMMV